MPQRPVARRWAAAVLLWTALPGCVTAPLDTDVDDPALGQGTVVIPLSQTDPTGDERVLSQFYDNVLRRLQQSYMEGDLPALKVQLAAYDKPAAPAWAREQLEVYSRLTAGLSLEQHCRQSARLVREDGSSPPIGAPLRFSVTIPGVPEVPVLLGAEDGAEPFSVGVLFRLEDRDAAGGVRARDSNQVVRLPKQFRLTAADSLRLPMELQSSADGAVVRTVTVWVELLPGYVRIDGQQVPVRRMPLIKQRFELYPQGFEAVRDRPMSTLREAIRRGDADHFPHVFLAAWLMPREQVEEAMTRLIQWVRIGREDQARVAMVALRRLANEDITIDDREGWLAWWRDRGR